MFQVEGLVAICCLVKMEFWNVKKVNLLFSDWVDCCDCGQNECVNLK